MNQLLSIVHDIYTAFNDDPTLDVQGMLWQRLAYEGLIYKLRQKGISGEALALSSAVKS